jgi:TIR domain
MQTSFTSFEPPEVFISYATKDQDLLEEFKPHLEGLERRGIIRSWWGYNIVAGAEWENEIRERMKSAQLILLLVSKHFLASESCYGFELQLAMERYETGAARVISVILSESNWRDTQLKKLQVLPKGGKPVDRWENINEAFVNVTEGITEAVRQLNRQPGTPKPVARDPSIKRKRRKPGLKYVLGIIALVIVSAVLIVFAVHLPWSRSLEPNAQSAESNSSSSEGEFKIQVTDTPPYDSGGPNSSGHIGGIVEGARSPAFHLVIYSFTNTWYVQPWANDKDTRIKPDGSWSAEIKTGTRYAVLLVRSDFRAPSAISTDPTRLDGVVTSIEFPGKR